MNHIDHIQNNCPIWKIQDRQYLEGSFVLKGSFILKGYQVLAWKILIFHFATKFLPWSRNYFWNLNLNGIPEYSQLPCSVVINTCLMKLHLHTWVFSLRIFSPWVFWHTLMFSHAAMLFSGMFYWFRRLYESSGGNLVDGSPPAASKQSVRTSYSSVTAVLEHTIVFVHVWCYSCMFN